MKNRSFINKVFLNLYLLIDIGLPLVAGGFFIYDGLPKWYISVPTFFVFLLIFAGYGYYVKLGFPRGFFRTALAFIESYVSVFLIFFFGKNLSESILISGIFDITGFVAGLIIAMTFSYSLVARWKVKPEIKEELAHNSSGKWASVLLAVWLICFEFFGFKFFQKTHQDYSLAVVVFFWIAYQMPMVTGRSRMLLNGFKERWTGKSCIDKSLQI
ncbi:MAG: hypothetical protein ACD_51C00279G0005 [uncultured bacterium]|nr:MAG: hypothetical protein ACD_51C00279G0005 [uncultured bacterium]OGJ48542.1 MAG: hypothetical protein A2244_02520 [Candidatus Peregrinibacteria bacterium RIFOXYA2_FULL_41_18]OGJ48874.1 MAG: hypothetical protein A2344_02920 [Candidatus Peregrinibacteria bacterium RIFOXYB12_FULL_41_12]OGJ53210.1 MAG: hypothetical protein A2448_00890 [Candidatus Peregrinibacteria bacterium RIFOXYC2_FULL_41_22]OGJ53934.1 MAG: hypothetical protein A2336_00580 [Candidatus Peregrinibacteria bacterium RIFOXYB2_FULL